ncbi:MAG: hypothetical protein HOM31_14455 [Gemmatimonadetes bacterium]|nr:hypothetical protein [Gemmatimonadota bacterium]
MEEEVSLLLEFEKTTCLWTVVGDASRPQPSEHEEDLLTAIHELVAQGEIVTTTAVAAKIQRDKGQVSRTMKRLRLAGRLIKGKPIGREQPYLPVDGINGVNGQTSPYGKPLTVDSIDSGGNGIEGRGLFATGKGAIKKVLGLNGNS